MPDVNNKQNQNAASDTVVFNIVEEANEISTLASAVAPSRESEQVTDKSTCKVDHNVQVDIVVAVQASIRGYLVSLCQTLGSLQVTCCNTSIFIHRYLVRTQAIGTLRCILAVAKIQQIIRARLAIRSTDFAAKEKLNEEMKAQKVKNIERKSKKTPIVIRNLASNPFASQLLKSTLKTKPIHISCNPSSPDSKWIWLERWMSLTSSDPKKLILKQDDLGEDVNTDLNPCEANNKLTCSDPVLPVDIVIDSISNCSEKIELDNPISIQKHCSKSQVLNDQLESHTEETISKNECSNSLHSEIFLSSDPVSEFKLNGDSNKPNHSEEMNKNSARKELHETPEMETGRVMIESKKSKNPGFAAVQAKFEELSAASSSNRSLSHASKDTKSDSKSVHSQFNELRPIENNDVTFELGNEISTTSIADRSEAGLSELVPEVGTSKGKSCIVASSTELNSGDMAAENEDFLCDSNEGQRQIMAEISENSARLSNTPEPIRVKQQSAESTTSNTHMTDSSKGPKIDRSSQEGSPRSHVTVPESQWTPPSQISAHEKTTKAENNVPLRKKRLQILINSSPTNLKNDSGAQTSGEHLKKEMKSVKRRNSFSTVKTDHVDHENSSSGSNLLPSYMQPTESARAKVNMSLSQKLSPDLHDKDNHVKKRQSLPNGDGNQGSSPRMQRSTSQVQQNLKGNGIHSPHNSTDRRWLR
ncbi:protein IQ-DOMAIN 32-like [Phalaenopsis equestris]|uniref:protein IQ-DOMAIN 32-like n=1 Tax=Phalaenopsis equestris TaxID=78828 RepID=UPI0009E48BA9|nr:protein IQ-DOMAIN 32-like [Phalaenopsis equestris]